MKNTKTVAVTVVSGTLAVFACIIALQGRTASTSARAGRYQFFDNKIQYKTYSPMLAIQDIHLVIETGVSALRWTRTNSNNTPTEVALPFDQAGSICSLSTSHVLVSGRSSSSAAGYLVVVEVTENSAPRLTIAAQVSTGSLDPWDIYWNPADSNLYVLDYVTAEIRFASWVPVVGQIVIPPPTTFTTIAAPAAVSLLSEFLSRRASIEILGPLSEDPPDQLSAGVGLERRGHNSEGPWLNVRLAQSQWIVEYLFTQAELAPTAWAVHGRRSVTAAGPVSLAPPGPGPFEVLEALSGTVVVTGVAPSTNTVQVALPAGGLAAGLDHKITGGGYGESRVFLPLLRYGKPTHLGQSEVRLTMADTNEESRIDSPDFALSTIASHVDNAAEGDVTMEVYLVVNTLPSTGPPPITINGDLAILDPLAVFGPVSYQFKQDDPLSVGLQMDQPLPDDANLVGTAFLWQFVTVTPAGPAGQISVSDVVGSVVHPKVAAPAAATAKAGSPTSGMPAARRRAVLNFCASCKEPRLSVSATRALVRAVRQQARRAR